jgi:hypothetical protein
MSKNETKNFINYCEKNYPEIQFSNVKITISHPYRDISFIIDMDPVLDWIFIHGEGLVTEALKYDLKKDISRMIKDRDKLHFLRDCEDKEISCQSRKLYKIVDTNIDKFSCWLIDKRTEEKYIRQYLKQIQVNFPLGKKTTDYIINELHNHCIC